MIPVRQPGPMAQMNRDHRPFFHQCVQLMPFIIYWLALCVLHQLNTPQHLDPLPHFDILLHKSSATFSLTKFYLQRLFAAQVISNFHQLTATNYPRPPDHSTLGPPHHALLPSPLETSPDKVLAAQRRRSSLSQPGGGGVSGRRPPADRGVVCRG
jgi:hypothetical protein